MKDTTTLIGRVRFKSVELSLVNTPVIHRYETVFLLYLQPIPLDRFIIIDAEATHAGMLAFFLFK